MASRKPKAKSVKVIIHRLEKALYEEMGEEDSHYQEGYSDGMRALAKYVKVKK